MANIVNFMGNGCRSPITKVAHEFKSLTSGRSLEIYVDNNLTAQGISV